MTGIIPYAELSVTISSLFILKKTTTYFIIIFNLFPPAFTFPDQYILWDIFVTPGWDPKFHCWTSGMCPELSHLSKPWLIAWRADNSISFIYLLVWEDPAVLPRRVIYHEDSCWGVCGRWKQHRRRSASTVPNTDFFLHTSRYSNNHRKKNPKTPPCSRFWSVCYLKTSPKLPSRISAPTRTPTSLQESPSHMNSWEVEESSSSPSSHQHWTTNKKRNTLLTLLVCYNSFGIALCI